MFDEYWFKKDFVKKNREKINELIDPDDSLYLLFSLDDNPDFDMQDELSTIMQRYHMG